MPVLKTKTALIREKRLGAIAAYSGLLSSLLKEAATGELAPRGRTFSQDAASDIQCALDLLGSLEGAAIVVHGPVGCAAGLRRDAGAVAARWLSTGLSERDSIVGAEGKLQQAIVKAAQAWSPAVIFVVATPVVAINNDDIESVVIALREELAAAIVPVYVDGFRSRLGATGHDVAIHAIVKHLLPRRPGARSERVNLLATTESRADVAAVTQLLSEIGLQANVFPRFAPLGDLAQVTEARLSVAIEPQASGYAGSLLEQVHGVAFLQVPTPVGVGATSRWLAAVAERTGLSERAAAVIDAHRNDLAALWAQARAVHGASVFVNLSADKALAFAGLASELGLTVAGLKCPALGLAEVPALQALLGSVGDLPILLGDGQVFEEVNLLRRLRPALYVGEGNAATHALRLGIPVLDLGRHTSLGYAGVADIVQGIRRTLANTALPRFLQAAGDGPYSPRWLARSTHWYIKHETK